MPTLTTTDPRTGVRADHRHRRDLRRRASPRSSLAPGAPPPLLAGHDRAWRAGLLDALADALEERRSDLVATAAAETGLADARLNGELTRTVFQLRLFAEAVREGSFLEAAIDHAAETPMGPRPGRAPDAGADRPGRRVRVEQLPLRVLGARRRHRLGARRGQSRRSRRPTARIR